MPPNPSPRSPLELPDLQEAAGPDWHVELLEETPSTNAVARTGPDPHRVVVTNHQTQGRGRLDRVWATPAGTSLTFSAVVDPQLEPRWWPMIPLMTGLAVAGAIGPEVGLKWPNDVLIDSRKVCGILVERVEAADPVAVIGIGINVHQTHAELPVDTATSLAIEALQQDRTTLLGGVLRELRSGLGQLRSDPQGLLAAYRERCVTLGRDVRVQLPGADDLVGRAVDVDESGRLVVAAEPGRHVAVSAGDVVHVRPAG